MAKTSIVLTVLGEDRPGLVEAIADVVAAHQANWIESRMAHLAGQFAGILRVEVDEARADSLAAALGSVSTAGIETIVKPDPTPTAALPSTVRLLDVTGHDQPGIVRQISRVLAASGVNVEELTTQQLPAANTGQPIFNATAKLRLPASADESALRESLEAVAADLVVDIRLATPADSSALK